LIVLLQTFNQLPLPVMSSEQTR